MKFPYIKAFFACISNKIYCKRKKRVNILKSSSTLKFLVTFPYFPEMIISTQHYYTKDNFHVSLMRFNRQNLYKFSTFLRKICCLYIFYSMCIIWAKNFKTRWEMYGRRTFTCFKLFLMHKKWKGWILMSHKTLVFLVLSLSFF